MMVVRRTLQVRLGAFNGISHPLQKLTLPTNGWRDFGSSEGGSRPVAVMDTLLRKDCFLPDAKLPHPLMPRLEARTTAKQAREGGVNLHH